VVSGDAAKRCCSAHAARHRTFWVHLARSLVAQPELGVLVDKKEQSLGEQLEGHDLTNSGFQIHFMQDVPVTKLCSQTLDRETALVFGAAVETHYW
jgi:hypothetical protein